MKRNIIKKAKAVRKIVTTKKDDRNHKGFRTGIKAGQFGMSSF